MFELKWTVEAAELFQDLEQRAEASVINRKKKGQKKSSKIEGLFKQIYKTLDLLKSNPRHPGLHTHPYYSIENPYHPTEKVFEAYAQNKTPSAYRVFWCYGPEPRQMTILSIVPHP